MAEALSCREVRSLAADLALGTLEGRERGAALTHVAACPACRALVASLSGTADRLLALAPTAEPPVGFESDVIARIQVEVEGGDGATARRRGRPLRAVAAALLLLLGGVGLGLLASRGSDDATATLTSAPMEAPDGETVGEVWRYGEEDTVIFVSVPAWADLDPEGSMTYAFRLEAEEGITTEVGEFTLGDGRSAWGTTTEAPGEEIAAVSVVDDTGRVWCTGRFA